MGLCPVGTQATVSFIWSLLSQVIFAALVALVLQQNLFPAGPAISGTRMLFRAVPAHRSPCGIKRLIFQTCPALALLPGSFLDCIFHLFTSLLIGTRL